LRLLGVRAAARLWRYAGASVVMRLEFRAAFSLFAVLVGASHARAACLAPRDLVHFSAPLPHLAQVMRAKRNVRIVALGSSSTAGSGASSAMASYPARLDIELEGRFPAHDFDVANFGVGGQLAADMVARIENEVLAQSPDLVIWQTGVNDAVTGVGRERFKSLLEHGIGRLKQAGVDVVLLDMQYYPRAGLVAGYFEYLDLMRQAAEKTKTPLFRRYQIMTHLVKSGQYTTQELLAADQFHLNDVSYRCLAALLADAIEDQLDRARVARNQAALAPNLR
jgi:acyl-CoA thioesterase-1